MDTAILVFLSVASVLSASSSSKTTQCSNVTDRIWAANRSRNNITLTCHWNDGVSIPIIEAAGATIQWYFNSEEITNSRRIGEDGIGFTLVNRNDVRNAILNISLPKDHSRIQAEGNYSCGCEGFQQRGNQVLIGE